MTGFRLRPRFSALSLASQIFTNTMPYAGIQRSEQVTVKIARGYKPVDLRSDESLDVNLRALLERSWDSDPNARPTIQDCRQVLVDLMPVPGSPPDLPESPSNSDLDGTILVSRVSTTRLQVVDVVHSACLP